VTQAVYRSRSSTVEDSQERGLRWGRAAVLLDDAVEDEAMDLDFNFFSLTVPERRLGQRTQALSRRLWETTGSVAANCTASACRSVEPFAVRGKSATM
jgi:hypothetical protein